MSISKEMHSNEKEPITDQNKSNIDKLGYDEWFDAQSREFLQDGFSIARVIEVNKNNFKVSDGEHDIFAELSGKFLFTADNSTDYPTVGDWVIVQVFDDFSLAIIHQVLPRKSLLKRKDPGKAVEFQLIAANIDYAFIVQSVDSNFNLNRLERYFVMIHESKIQPIVVLSKTDLISEDDLVEILEKISRFNDRYPILPISSLTDDGIPALTAELQSGKSYCLMGSSGVGKTTLLNKLLGEERFDVNEVREGDSKGRHTTTRRQMTRLDSGSIFIDTPGMRELGNFAVDGGLEETFDEIVEAGKQCRYKDCSHIHEQGCAVKEAVEQGIIDQERYDNYLQIQKEAAFYEMSFQDKRKKDKSLSKTIKNYYKITRKK